ncbi:hypothetical protein BD769DRAFT_1383181 [Suillus cothurnatus]|nr:hypothetical protein BD769DRAFT_1383181 [Suillus cothurnatus]
MFTRVSIAAFIILFISTAVNAGIVPAARAIADFEKRSDTVGNYAEPAIYAEPVNYVDQSDLNGDQTQTPKQNHLASVTMSSKYTSYAVQLRKARFLYITSYKKYILYKKSSFGCQAYCRFFEMEILDRLTKIAGIYHQTKYPEGRRQWCNLPPVTVKSPSVALEEPKSEEASRNEALTRLVELKAGD